MFQEKRTTVRTEKNAAVHVDVISTSGDTLGQKIRYEGSTRDISQQGIRLHGKHSIKKGSILDMFVELEADHSHYRLKGDVKWVTETTEHEYVAGLQLIEGESTDFSEWKEHFA